MSGRHVNRVILIGRLGRDPDFQVTDEGESVVRCALATNSMAPDGQGGWVQRTEWHAIVIPGWCSGDVADHPELFRKGAAIYIEGRLRRRRADGRWEVHATKAPVWISGLKDSDAEPGDGPDFDFYDNPEHRT